MSGNEYGTTRIGKTSAGVFASNSAGVVLGLANSIFLTRTLGVTGRGEFAVFSASFGLLALLLGLGLDPAIRYHAARGRIPADRILTSLLLFVLGAGALVLGLARLNHTLFENEILLPGTMQGFRHELLLAGVVVSNLFHTSVSAVFAGHRRFGVLNVTSVTLSAASVVVFGVLFAGKSFAGWTIGTEGVFVAFLGLQLFNAVVVGTLGYRLLGLRWSSFLIDGALAREMLGYATLTWVANITQFLNYRVDIWIVQSLEGVEALGLYSLAANLAMMLWLLPRSASTVLLPTMASADADVSFAQTARVARILAAAMVVLAIPTALLAGFFVPLLYGAEFAGSALPFGLLLIGAAPFSLCIVQAGVLGGVGRVDVNVWASLGGLVATIVLDFALIPRYGIAGAALASSASYLLTTVIVAVGFSRIGRVPLMSSILPQPADVRYLINGLKSFLR